MNLLTILLQAPAPAAGGQGGQPGAAGGGLSMIIMLVALFAIMYLFMIRPQRKQQKEQQKFRDALEKGQKVVTIGGLYGEIREVGDTWVMLSVDKDVLIKVDKAAIQALPTPRQ